jgi:hypothetical protein
MTRVHAALAKNTNAATGSDFFVFVILKQARSALLKNLETWRAAHSRSNATTRDRAPPRESRALRWGRSRVVAID